MRQTIETIQNEISQERLLSVIGRLSAYHRMQASRGYRAAAGACIDLLKSSGIDAELLEYPANYGLTTMTQELFQAWDCNAAWCRLVAPHDEMLADYSAQPIAVFQKSYPCDYRDRPLDIVLLDKGSDPAAYEGLDLAGKIIFVRDDFNAYLDWAVRKGGAVGIISDYVVAAEGVRSRHEMWKVRKYTTFWWMHDEPSRPFGFVITPEQGERLAALCRRMAPACPKAACYVDAAFAPGIFENVSALLPGESGEEILLLAHLCHPSPSANDNLSGVSAAMEAVKVLHDLIERGALPPLKRGIRLLLVPEYLGTFAYLDTPENAERIKGGLNLDMVGGKQELGYGPLTLSGVPDALPSFVHALGELVLRQINDEVPGFSPSYRLPRYNTVSCGFVSGSDNFILSDPTIGIPSPMLSQWPDKFYHTSGDDITVISPGLMRKSAATAAAYAYLLATLSLQNAEEIARQMVVRLPQELTECAMAARREGVPVSYAMIKSTQAAIACLRSLEGYFIGDEQRQCQTLCNRAENAMRGILAAVEEYCGDGAVKLPESRGMGKIPQRLYRGPLNVLDGYADSEEKREALRHYRKELRPKMSDAALAELFCQYYADGHRTAAGVVALTRLACEGGEEEALLGYLDMLAVLGLVEMKSLEDGND